MQPTFEDLLQVFPAEDGPAWVGRVGDNQTGCPLIDEALHVLQVDLP